MEAVAPKPTAVQEAMFHEAFPRDSAVLEGTAIRETTTSMGIATLVVLAQETTAQEAKGELMLEVMLKVVVIRVVKRVIKTI